MIDQNTIIEIINNSLPIVATVASSKSIVKLLDIIEKSLKALYMPSFTLKNGKAKVDVEMYRKKQEGLLENQIFTVNEVRKLKNFINTTNFAKEELENFNGFCSDDNIDFDWLMRFFDAVSNISNEELQRLWGKILAGEIRQPGICSLRTIECVRNMSQKEAEIYNKLCKYVLKSGNCYFIFNYGFCESDNYNKDCVNYILKTGLNYSESIIPMLECGLLSIDNALATNFKTDNILAIQNDKVICFVITDRTKESFISIEPYFLTNIGIELFNIIQSMPAFKSNVDYQTLCFKTLKEQYIQNTELTICAYNIIGEDEFDPNDLL